MFCSRRPAFGLALMSREPWIDLRMEHFGDAGVPSVAVDYVRCDRRFTILGTHPVPPPTPEGFRLRNQQLDAVADHVSGLTHTVMVAGDLNVTPWSYWFRRFVVRSRLNDTAPGYGVHPTWFGPSFLFAIPIDHVLVSGDLVVIGRRISRDVGSDHRALIVDLTFQ
ncbi:MAG: endonuclease/exonuclease/phosphatase family protein [bacterium]